MKVLRTCENIMALLETWGHTENVSRKELEKAVSWVRDAVDERTMKRWIDALETFGFIKRENKQIYGIVSNLPHRDNVGVLSLSQKIEETKP